MSFAVHGFQAPAADPGIPLYRALSLIASGEADDGDASWNDVAHKSIASCGPKFGTDQYHGQKLNRENGIELAALLV